MTDIRIWHHGLDQYHAAYRMIRLLHYFQHPMRVSTSQNMPISKLKILDMFLAYPSLLYGLSYSREVRNQLKTLDITKPEDSFVNLPPAQSLFRSMEIVQKIALTDLTAKGILNKEKFLIGDARLNENKITEKLLLMIKTANEAEYPVLSFIMGNLGTMDINGPGNIFRIAGVHRSFT